MWLGSCGRGKRSGDVADVAETSAEIGMGDRTGGIDTPFVRIGAERRPGASSLECCASVGARVARCGWRAYLLAGGAVVRTGAISSGSRSSSLLDLLCSCCVGSERRAPSQSIALEPVEGDGGGWLVLPRRVAELDRESVADVGSCMSDERLRVGLDMRRRWKAEKAAPGPSSNVAMVGDRADVYDSWSGGDDPPVPPPLPPLTAPCIRGEVMGEMVYRPAPDPVRMGSRGGCAGLRRRVGRMRNGSIGEVVAWAGSWSWSWSRCAAEIKAGVV